MNAIHRSVWNDSTQTYVAVSELARAHGGGGGVGGVVTGAETAGGTGSSAGFNFALTALAAVGLLFGATLARANPAGGVLVVGAASISTQGARLTVTQTSQNAAINWQSFNVGAAESVQFVQPNAQAVALNRVVGADPSRILGSLNANGQVFIVNPNGILFGQGAAVNVQGLVASTLALTDADFMARQYKFGGTSVQAVENAGSLNADGGYVALLGARVRNTGTITATLGTVALAAGQGVVLDIAGDKLLKVHVDSGVLNALVDNGGLIQADGGQVLMTVQATGALLNTVVNNTGVVQARTVRTQGGVIKLLGDMQGGTVNVAGRLDASAPAGGDGGFVETSAAQVKVAPGTVVTTQAAGGVTGRWLIDPSDYLIAPDGTAGSNISGATLSSNLAASNVEIFSSQGAKAAGTGSILVEDSVTWLAHTLTLTAANNIVIGSATRQGSLNVTGTAGVILNTATANGSGSAATPAVAGGTLVITPAAAAGGGINAGAFNGQINLTANAKFTLNGTDYTVITALGSGRDDTSGTTLQGIAGALTGKFVLGADILATTTSGWGSGDNAGFKPIGSYVDSNAKSDPPLPPKLDQTKTFTGVFEGLGHVINDLTVKSSDVNGTGMFGVTGGQSISTVGTTPTTAVALIQNLELRNPTVAGVAAVGALVGFNSGLINNSHVTGLTGLVVGANTGSGASTAYADYVGGLVGQNIYNISRSSASASVSSTNATAGTSAKPQLAGLVGGLVGFNAGDVTRSNASGAVSGYQYVGGLVGNNAGTVTSSFASGAVTAGSTGGGSQLGGLVGTNGGSITGTAIPGNLTDFSSATGPVTGTLEVGGLVGLNRGSIDLSQASGTVKGSAAVGGLVGANRGMDGGIGRPGTTAKVSGTAGTTGSSASITTSFASGQVGISGTTDSVGGLVGLNASGNGGAGAAGCNDCAPGGIGGKGGLAGISQSYSTATVVGRTDVGGLVGRNDSGALGVAGTDKAASDGKAAGVGGAAGSLPGAATLIDTYASGAVTGSALNAGGLVGANVNPSGDAASPASVATSFSSSTVNGGGTAQGLAIGLNTRGLYANSYYLTKPSGQPVVNATGTGALDGFSPLSASQFAAIGSATSFSGFNFSSATASGIWGQTSASGQPFLCAVTPGCSIDVRVEVFVTNAGSDAKSVPYVIAPQSYYGASVPAFEVRLVSATGTVVTLPSSVTATWSTTPTTATLTTNPAALFAPSITTPAGKYNVGYKPESLILTSSDPAVQALVASFIYSTYGAGLPWTVSRAPVTVMAPTVADARYGAGTTATLSATRVLLPYTNNVITGNGIYGSDDVTLVRAPTGSFSSRYAGTAIPVTYLDTLTGAQASNYQLVLPIATGTITKAPLTVTGTTMAAKTYDGSSSVSVSGGRLARGSASAITTASGVVSGDNVQLVAATSGTFTPTAGSPNCANVGACTTVTVVDTLSGTSAGNYVLTSPSLLGSIKAAPLMVSGVSVLSRAYDGTTSASLSGSATLVAATGNTIAGGIFAGDNVALSNAPTSGSFRVAAASASAQAVTVNASLTGLAAANYVLVAPVLTGFVNPAALTVSGSAAANKTYDGTTAALLTGSTIQAGSGNLIGTATGVFAGDAVTLVGAGNFASANAGSAAQTVTPALSLSGLAAGNYVLTQPANLAAVIAPAQLTVSGMTVLAHSYDGSASATLLGGVLAAANGNTLGGSGGNSGNGVFSADRANVSLATASTGSFPSANASPNAQTVTALNTLTLSGGAIGNYVLVQPLLSGFINPAPLTVAGLHVATKTYDGSATATFSGSAALVTADGNRIGGTGILPADAAGVALNPSTAGSFASPNASATAQAVTTASSLTLSGSAIGNYVLVQPVGLSGIIKPAALAVTGTTVADKTFDGGTAATASGGVLVAGVGNAIGTATGVFGSDAVTLVQAGRFANANANSQAQSVSSADLLSGASAGNYVLTAPTGWTATITPAPLTVTGASVLTRSYDGSRTVRLSGGVLAAAAGNSIGAAIGAGTGTNGVLTSDAANVTLVSVATGQITSANASAAAQSVSVGYGLTLSGAAVGNYTLVQPLLAGVITPAPLTAAGTTVLTRSYDASVTATVLGGTLAPAAGNTIGGSGVLLADAAGVAFTPATSGIFASVNASASAQLVTLNDGLTLSGSALGNYVFVQPTVSGLITPAPLTVSGSAVATRTYDGSTLANLSGGSLVAAPGNTMASSTGGTGIHAADAVHLTLQLAATGSYATANASAAAQTVSVANTLAGTAAHNYLLVQPDLSGFITPAPLTVIGTTVAARTYDGSTLVQLSGGALAPAVGNTLGSAFGGLLASDAEQVQLVLAATGTLATPDASANARSVNAGASLVLTGAATGNYVLIQPALSALISQAPITVVGTRVVDKTFNGNTLASLIGGQFSPVNTGSAATRNTVAGNGVVASDAANLVLNQTGYFSGARASASAVSVTASDSLSGSAAGNYVLVQPTGLTGALLPAPLTLANVVVAAKIYDGSNAAVVSAGTLTGAPGNTIGGAGVLSADVTNVVLTTVTSGTFASANASPAAQPVNVANSLVVTGAAAGNYVLVQPTLTGTISPAPLTVSGTLVSAKTYDGTRLALVTGGTLVPVLTGTAGSRNPIATASGVLAADAAQVTLVQTASFADANANSAVQVVTASDALVLSGSAAGNYVLVQPTGLSGFISPAPLTVSGAVALNKVYDGTASAMLSGGSLVGALGSHGVVSADAAHLSLTQTGVFASVNANPAAQAVTAIDTLSGSAAANYVLVQPTGLSAVIAPAPLTLAGASVLARSYDGSRSASLVGATLAAGAGNPFGGNGVFSADAAGVNLLSAGSATFASPNAAAGVQAVSVNATLALTGSAAGNYLLVQPTGLVGVITPAPLTVVGASVANKVFDGTTLAALDGARLAPVAGAAMGTNTIPTATGVLASDAASVVLSAAGNFATRNASAAAQAVSVNANLTLSGPATGNYVLVQPANLAGTISPATVTLTATADQKTYDGTASALATPRVSGLVAGSSISGVTESYQSANVMGAGASTLRVNSGWVISDSANYTVAVNPAAGTITPAALSVIDTLVGNKVYDGSTATTVSGGVLVGLFNHDAVTLLQSGAFVSANAGHGVAAATLDALVGTGAGNYVVAAAVARSGNILPAPLTISGSVVANKAFDTSNVASLSAGSLVGVVAGDRANVSLNQSGYFTRSVPDSSIPVTTTATLGGAAAANYVLIQPTGLVANISPNEQMPTVASLAVLVAPAPASLVSLTPVQPQPVKGTADGAAASSSAGAGAQTGAAVMTPLTPITPTGRFTALAGLNISVVDQGIKLPLANVAQP